MIVHDCVQGSSEWVSLHIGRPTVSRFGRIMTPAQRKYSKAAPGFIIELLTERLIGYPLDWGAFGDDEDVHGRDSDGNVWTRRGKDMEAEARAWYAAYRDADVTEVGFVTTDDERIGGSPDAFVGDDGGLEIKCRGAKMHMRCVLGEDPVADVNQVQGYLWLTGSDWWDVCAYSPDLPNRIERHYPDPSWVKSWEQCRAAFWKDWDRLSAMLDGIDYCVEDDNLKALLVASLKAGVEPDPEALDLDEIDAFREMVRDAKRAGVLDEPDESKALGDVVAGRWSEVQQMRRYLMRSKELAT